MLSPQKGERCLCSSGFVGQSCQLGLRDDSGAGQWWEVSGGDANMPRRMAAAGVYLPSTEAMYLFGGKTLNTSYCFYFTVAKIHVFLR